MAFWDYLIYIGMGAKLLKEFSQCIEQKQGEGKPITFWVVLSCLGSAMDKVLEDSKAPTGKSKPLV